jgi:hypothetical protein
MMFSHLFNPSYEHIHGPTVSGGRGKALLLVNDVAANLLGETFNLLDGTLATGTSTTNADRSATAEPYCVLRIHSLGKYMFDSPTQVIWSRQRLRPLAVKYRSWGVERSCGRPPFFPPNENLGNRETGLRKLCRNSLSCDRHNLLILSMRMVVPNSYFQTSSVP